MSELLPVPAGGPSTHIQNCSGWHGSWHQPSPVLVGFRSRPQLAWIYPTSHVLCLQAFMRRTAELQRLAWIYPTSRMQHIVARAWQAKQEAALQAAQASEGVAVQVSYNHSPAVVTGRQAVVQMLR